MQRGHKCDYKKQIREELLDDAVAEVIVKLVSNPQFAAMMQEKINMKVDTTAIDQEIANYEKNRGTGRTVDCSQSKKDFYRSGKNHR